MSLLDHVAGAAAAWSACGIGEACRDPAEASQRLCGAYSPNRLRLTGRGGLAMRLAQRRSGNLTLSSLSFAAPVELTQAAERGFVLVTTQLQGKSEIQGGAGRIDGGPGLVVVDSARGEVVKRFSGDSRRLNVRIEQERIDTVLAQLLGHPSGERLDFAPAMANAAARDGWLAILALLLEGPVHDLVRDRIEEMAILHLLTSHRHSHVPDLARPAPSLAPRRVRVAEDYIRRHATEALTLGGIAAAAETSIRSLSAGFREFRQTTPMCFLQEVRLDAVRSSLREAAPGTRVIDVALDHGFAHSGRFAALYRRRFGEAPAATLRNLLPDSYLPCRMRMERGEQNSENHISQQP